MIKHLLETTLKATISSSETNYHTQHRAKNKNKSVAANAEKLDHLKVNFKIFQSAALAR